jgi:hypothetical protein
MSKKLTNSFKAGLKIIPNPLKAHKKACEDAAYINSKLLVVADGVSSW